MRFADRDETGPYIVVTRNVMMCAYYANFARKTRRRGKFNRNGIARARPKTPIVIVL